MKYLFSADSILLSTGLLLVRILVGGMILYHGFEIFNSDTMQMYLSWKVFHGNTALVYTGKLFELLSGITILAGIAFRIGSLLMIGTLGFVTFFVGHGKFWYEDQHPFMFVVIGLLFLFTGAGRYSIDFFIAKKN